MIRYMSEDVEDAVEQILPLLPKSATVRSDVLSRLLVIWLAGYRSDNPWTTRQMREAALDQHLQLVRDDLAQMFADMLAVIPDEDTPETFSARLAKAGFLRVPSRKEEAFYGIALKDGA